VNGKGGVATEPITGLSARRRAEANEGAGSAQARAESKQENATYKLKFKIKVKSKNFLMGPWKNGNPNPGFPLSHRPDSLRREEKTRAQTCPFTQTT
jgi:hypothetical protein